VEAGFSRSLLALIERPSGTSAWHARSRLAANFLFVENLHAVSDRIKAIFEREMSGLEAMHLCMWQDFEKRVAPCRGKEDITLAPKDDGLRLVLLQKRLPFWI
jgi:hypothetical protein